MTDAPRLQAEAERLRAGFAARGAEAVECDILLPAETLLDLYGEDIRARAYVTQDPLRGEMMLRPDFTVPLVSRLAGEGRSAGRFTYAGEVFRIQDKIPDRPPAHLQVGYEIIGPGDAAEAEAEVFAALAGQLTSVNFRIGDIGLLRDAVAGLDTTAARKAALLHHLWRPRRFRALLDRFARRTAPDAARLALLDKFAPLSGSAVEIGLRSRAEVEARLTAMRDDHSAPPISERDVTLIEALASVRETADNALERLRDIAMDLPAIQPGVERLAARLEALAARGFAPETLLFDASFGRTSMEYYDGFVFAMVVPDRPDLPAVASGGRYDALTRALGLDAPAVGGVIRPALALGGEA